MSDPDETRQLGVQPLDEILNKLELTNRDLVAASTEQLTHKQVQKSRNGRRVTPNIQQKILRALNGLSPDGGKQFTLPDLFTY